MDICFSGRGNVLDIMKHEARLKREPRMTTKTDKCRHCEMTALYPVYDQKGRMFCSFDCKTDWEGHCE